MITKKVLPAAALGLLACTSVERPRQPQSGDVAPAVVSPAETTTPVPPPAPVVAPTAEPAMPTLALAPVVRSRSVLHMFETIDGTLFVAANAQAIEVPDTGPLAREPRFLDGIVDPGMLAMVDWRASMVAGRWPDALHLVVEAEGERWAARPAVYRFTGNRWTRIANVEGTLAWVYPAITPWTDGAMLTVRSHRSADAESEGEEWSEAQVKALERALAKAAPHEFETIGGKATNVPSFGERKILAFASLSSGDAVVIAEESALFWSGDNRKPSKARLARAVVDEPQVLMRSASDVWMYDGAGLQHFDGAAWTTVETPQSTSVASFAIDSAGKQWLVHGSSFRFSADENAIYEREPGGKWTQMQLPAIAFPSDARPQIDYWGDAYEPLPPDPGEGAEKHPLVPIQVLARDEGLWLVARGPEFGEGGDFRWALLHEKDRGAVLEVPDPETMRRELIDRRPEVPFTGKKDCDVFVPIAVDDVAGDQRALRDELGKIALPAEASLLLLEVVRDGKPAIGAMIRAAVGKKTAKRIVAALKAPLGERMGKPICQEMIGKRLLEQWSGR